MFPQCGFSAAASSFYAGGVISVGTLMAVFLSTSDEMLPIFISESVELPVILKILGGVKILIGAVSGFVLDILWRAGSRKRKEYHEHRHIHKEHHEKDIHDLCEHEHCHCEEGSILKSAVIHSLQITLFIFLVTLVIGFLVEVLGEDQIGAIIGSQPVLGVLLAGLVGMIPNCAGFCDHYSDVPGRDPGYRTDAGRSACRSRRGDPGSLPDQPGRQRRILGLSACSMGSAYAGESFSRYCRSSFNGTVSIFGPETLWQYCQLCLWAKYVIVKSHFRD